MTEGNEQKYDWNKFIVGLILSALAGLGAGFLIWDKDCPQQEPTTPAKQDTVFVPADCPQDELDSMYHQLTWYEWQLQDCKEYTAVLKIQLSKKEKPDSVSAELNERIEQYKLEKGIK